MKKMTTAACALALGFAWAAAPAVAQTTTQDKAEQKAQKIEQKGEQKADALEQKADKTRAKADEKADKVREGDTVGGKMDSAWDKTKAKSKEVGNKVKDAVTPDKEKAEMAVDVRGAQQALRDKGFDPGPVDGRMGPRTAEAVREFQSREGIVATGQLDAETRARLMGSRADSSAPSASPATSATSNSNPNTSDHNTKAKK
jgi:Putative peptidoglycan binding domain